ncbi:MAG: pyrogallol hydroxytransferase large subunit, partial [Alphaproteobacteria bacterium]
MRLSLMLFGLSLLLKFSAWRYPAFRARLKERNLIAQIRTWDGSVGRHYIFQTGRVSSRAGLHPDPDISMSFKTPELGASLLMPPINWLDQINALKDFKLTMEGDDGLANWFAQTTMMTQNLGWKWGNDIGDGMTRVCNMTNGGPGFVEVKDDKIIRMTP